MYMGEGANRHVTPAMLDTNGSGKPLFADGWACELSHLLGEGGGGMHKGNTCACTRSLADLRGSLGTHAPGV